MRFGKLNRDPGFTPKDVRCTNCAGLGYVIVVSSPMRQENCAKCEGTGKREVQVARTLSGDNDPTPDLPW